MENVSETVSKAIDVLEVFLQKDGEFSLAELTSLSGFNKATVYRLVSTLEMRGYIRQLEKNGKYSLGFKSLDFAYAIRKNIKFIELAYLYLSNLSKKRNLSAYVSILDNDSSLVVEEVPVVATMRINSPIGKRMPLHATASGMVLLSSLSKDSRQAFYARKPLKPFTSNTIIDIAQMEKEIEKIKTEGIAFSEEDYIIGLVSVAAPIYDGNNQIIAAAGIVAPISQYIDFGREKLAADLKSCSAEISQVMSRIS